MRPPTPPRRRAGEGFRQGTEGKKRTMGTLPSALGGPRNNTGGEMEVDTVQMNKTMAARPALGQARTNGSTTAIPGILSRKPSYPSSLGSGSAPPRQVMRNVSGMTDDPMDVTAAPSTTTTITTGGFRVASRREGLGSDTKGSLYGLSAALARLQVKASTGPCSTSTTPVQAAERRLGGFAMPTASSAAKSIAEPARPTGPGTLRRSSTMAMGQRRISSLSTVAHEPTPSFSRATSVAPESGLVRSGTIANLIESDAGTGCLKGVVAYVDVRTAEGDDAGTVFVDMLKSCGAKVSVPPSAVLLAELNILTDPPYRFSPSQRNHARISSTNRANRRRWHGTAVKKIRSRVSSVSAGSRGAKRRESGSTRRFTRSTLKRLKCLKRCEEEALIDIIDNPSS